MIIDTKDIFKTKRFSKIYLIYTDKVTNIKNKVAVDLHYSDDKKCTFTAKVPFMFKSIKNNPAQIIAYTKFGIYKMNCEIKNSKIVKEEVYYEVLRTSSWEFKQMRRSDRVKVTLPVCIKYNDGFEINTESFDLATHGVSVILKEKLSSIYERLSCKVIIKFPENILPTNEFVNDTSYIRKIEHKNGSYIYIYGFLNVSDFMVTILKDYIESVQENNV